MRDWPASWREMVIEHAGWEMFLMRLFLLWPIWLGVVGSVPDVQPHPTGIAHFMDLTWLGFPSVQMGVKWIFGFCAVGYLLGWWKGVASGVMVAILIGKGTLLNSLGATDHTGQLLALVVLGQSMVYGFQGKRGWTDNQAQVWAIHWSKVIIAASYVSAGVCKLLVHDPLWIVRVPYMALQVMKTNLQNSANDGSLVISRLAMEFPYWVMEHPQLARVFFGVGLVLELMAFLALVGRGWALMVGVGLLGLHFGVEILMGLNFRNHSYLLVIFYVNAPWLGKWLGVRVMEVWKGWRR